MDIKTIEKKQIEYLSTEQYDRYFYETPVMNYAKIPRRTMFFDIGISLSYQIVNIDNDRYPDLLVWYPRRTVIWSLSKNTIVEWGTSYYFSRPIPVDLNGDDKTDYIILIHNGYLDGYYPLSTLSPFIEIRTLERVVETIFLDSRIHIDSQTYYIYGNRIFIPWVRNIGLSSSHIGLIEIRLYPIQYYLYPLAEYTGSCRGNVCDFNTNYEVYILGYNDSVYLVPSGFEKILVVRIKNDGVELVETINLGYESIDDNIVLLGRTRVSLNVAGEGYNRAIQPFAYDWSSSKKTGLVFDNSHLIIPFGEASYSGLIWYGDSQYPARIEFIKGVVIFDTKARTHRYVNLMRTFTYKGSTYYPCSLSSISVNTATKTVYYGGLAYARSSPYQVRYIYYVGSYRYDNERFMHPLWVEELSSDINSKNTNLFLSDNGSIQVSPEKVKLMVSSSTYGYVLHSGRSGTYWIGKTIILNPLITDLDGNGADDIVFILYYASGDGSIYSGSYVYNRIVPKLVDYSYNYVVWYTIPRSKITLNYTDETRHEINMNLRYLSRGFSNLAVILRYQDGGIIFNKTYSYGSYDEIITLSKAGSYNLSLCSKTSYWVGFALETPNVEIMYNYSLVLSIIRVYDRTRILLLEPRINTLTPNLYINGLKLVFKLEKYDWSQKRWVIVSGEETQLTFRYLGNSYCYFMKDYAIEEPPYKPGPIPLSELSDNVSLCYNEASPGLEWSGATRLWDGSYGVVLKNLSPENSIYELRVLYNGSKTNLPSELIINEILLIKYPVTLGIEISDTYALRNHKAFIKPTYKYFDTDGYLHTANLFNGYVKYRVVNVSNNNTVYSGECSVINGVAIATIPREYVLPGFYVLEANYDYLNNLFSKTSLNASYRVSKIGFRAELQDLLLNKSVSEMDVVCVFTILRATGFEITSSNISFVSNGLRIEILNPIDNNTIVVKHTVKPFIDIDTSIFEENKTYVLIIEPVLFNWVYEPPRVTYILKTVPLGKVKVFIEPFILKTNSNTSIYTLTENKVYMKLLINSLYRNMTNFIFEKANFTIRIGLEEYVLKNMNETVFWNPITPGLWSVIGDINIDVGFRIIKLTDSRMVYVEPMPTRIEVGKGSITLDVFDLLGRRANGTLYVEIRSIDGKLLYRNNYTYSDESVVLNIGFKDWVYIYALFRGNGSYADSWRLIPLNLDESLFPMIKSIDEPSTSLIIFISLIIAIAILRKKRWKRD